MNIPTKTLSHGYGLPILGFGTWKMGEETSEHDREVVAVRAAIESGVTHIDTAEVYADGQAERVIAEAIKGVDRSSLQIVSKVSPRHFAADDLHRSFEASLERLGTDYLDTYLLHRPNADVPMGETFSATDKLIEEGLLKHVGVSNFNVSQLKEAQSVSNHPIVQNQVHYNLVYREPERRGVLEYCAAHDILFEAWSPLKDVPLDQKIITELADKYGKSPAQIALNWLITQPNVVTIVKSSDPEHLADNLGAVGWELEAADVARLSADFPNQQDVSHRVPLDDE